MAKKVLLMLGVSALLLTTIQAGEIKIHEWPVQFIPQEIPGLEIPVLMDVGFFVAVKDQDKLRIKLQQISITEYEGCTDMVLETNFNLTLSCQITPNGLVGGTYSCSISPADINAPGGTTTVCAKLKNANLVDTPGGTKDVKVATVKILVVPR
jgi:hypothetical protein